MPQTADNYPTINPKFLPAITSGFANLPHDSFCCQSAGCVLQRRKPKLPVNNPVLPPLPKQISGHQLQRLQTLEHYNGCISPGQIIGKIEAMLRSHKQPTPLSLADARLYLSR
jgi:hypothetical protein